MDHLENSVAHGLKLAGVEGMTDDLAPWLVRGLFRLCPDERPTEHITCEILRVLVFGEHAVVLLEEVLHHVWIIDEELETMWPEHSDASWLIFAEHVRQVFVDLGSVRLLLGALSHL